MDCNHARLLLHFVRPGSTELEPQDLDSLRQHLADCAACGAAARAEKRFDDVIGRAMHAVPLPLHLRQRVLDRLAKEDPYRRRRRLLAGAAAAAVLLLAAGVSWHVWLRPLPEIEIPISFVEARTPAAVEAWFRDHEGIDMVAPRYGPEGRAFNYELLESLEVAVHQGQPVPRLCFHSVEGGRQVTAAVWVLSERQFSFENLPSSVSGSTMVIGPEGGFVFIVEYSGGSLEPFLRPPLRGA
jgi:hypothetical protein